MVLLRRTPYLRLAALATCVSLVCASFVPAVALAAAPVSTTNAEAEAQLDEETEKVDESLAEIETMPAANAPAEDQSPPPEEPPPPMIDPGPEPVADDFDRTHPGRPLIVTGGVLIGIGVGSGAAAIVGAVLGAGANDIAGLEPADPAARERFGTGRTGNVLAAVGTVGVGVLFPIGGTLIGLGGKRNGKAKPGLALLQRTRLGATFGGAWGDGGGVTFSGRF